MKSPLAACQLRVRATHSMMGIAFDPLTSLLYSFTSDDRTSDDIHSGDCVYATVLPHRCLYFPCLNRCRPERFSDGLDTSNIVEQVLSFSVDMFLPFNPLDIIDESTLYVVKSQTDTIEGVETNLIQRSNAATGIGTGTFAHVNDLEHSLPNLNVRR